MFIIGIAQTKDFDVANTGFSFIHIHLKRCLILELLLYSCDHEDIQPKCHHGKRFGHIKKYCIGAPKNEADNEVKHNHSKLNHFQQPPFLPNCCYDVIAFSSHESTHFSLCLLMQNPFGNNSIYPIFGTSSLNCRTVASVLIESGRHIHSTILISSNRASLLNSSAVCF